MSSFGQRLPTAKSGEDRLIALQGAYGGRGVQFVAINSNNPYLSPPDTYAQMVARTTLKGFNFPYLKDETGVVARAYGALRTPTTSSSMGSAGSVTAAGSPTRAIPPG